MANEKHSLLNSTFPVDLPVFPELHLQEKEFKSSIRLMLQRHRDIPIRTKASASKQSTSSTHQGGSSLRGHGRVSHILASRGSSRGRGRAGFVHSLQSRSPRVVYPPAPPGFIPPGFKPVPGSPFAWTLTSQSSSPSTSDDAQKEASTTDNGAPKSAFMDALLQSKSVAPSFDSRDGKMRTDNNDVTYATSGQPLVDAFSEIEDVISGKRLRQVLKQAWTADSEATLKIIWNARSIHLGKSSRSTFYRAAGWLAYEHPTTLIENLPWLVRPLVPKKVPKKAEQNKDSSLSDEEDFELLEAPKDENVGEEPEKKKLRLDVDEEAAEFDIKYGVSHGYWKDLLNLLALAANDQLKASGDVRSVLNIKQSQKQKYSRNWKEGERKKQKTQELHEKAINKLSTDPFYKALHLSVARLFAEQLALDLTRLHSANKGEKKTISLAAKWAPSSKSMHDQHTCIVTSIAELLHPQDTLDLDPTTDRTTYLRHARIAYQSKTLSPLRKHLEIVERPITAEKFDEIKYDRLPSLAMKQYTPIFAKKDYERFDKYITRVAEGKSRISGATLLPSSLVAMVHPNPYAPRGQSRRRQKVQITRGLVDKKLRDIQLRSLDGQWKALVQRIKDSGTIESSIAVCDVSASMNSPVFPDGTCPMDSAVGLSLLLAEVTAPPFGGAFITFSEKPHIVRVGGAKDTSSLKEKVRYIHSSSWSMNTDFVAVFEKLILPLAIRHDLKQEEMVKQVFVFSDMQFDAANRQSESWSSSFERIKEQFEMAGYEMPKLVFWNLAGGKAGYDQHNPFGRRGGNDVAPKPVTASEVGTALVSGYSQGQMKMFLEGGSWEKTDKSEHDEIREVDGDNGEVVVEKVSKEKEKSDPLSTVRKAISHPAYRMLKVVD